MADSGILRSSGNLDPRAQEYIPRNPYLPLPQPQIYYPYPPPCPPPPPPPPPPYTSSHSEFQVIPFSFCETTGGVAYTQFLTPQAYVSPDHPLPPRVPPPCVTPSRTLLLSSVPTDVSESTVRRELEMFGDVRAVQMERVRDGVLTVHFYDIRHAQKAMVEIQEQHMHQQCRLRLHYDAVLVMNSPYDAESLAPPLPPPARGLIAGQAVWAQFTLPVTVDLPDGNNQGTVVIFNLDPEVSATNLRSIFEVFGHVKELRETPLKKHQRFVEFFDIRDAAKALAEMNGKEIHGRSIVLEFSRPGGHNKKLSKAVQNASSDLNFATNSRIGQCLPQPVLLDRTSGRMLANLPPRICSAQTPSLMKKTSFSKGSPKVGGNKSGTPSGAVEVSLSSMCINGGIGNENEESFNNRPPKKNSKKCYNSIISAGSKLQSKGTRLWKGSRPFKDFDPRFLINEDGILESNCKDSRTTVMIKNIPNKYSQKLLLNMLDNHCIHCNEQIVHGDDQLPLSSYDFVYLPIDFNNKCNVGYGFVNMTSPEATWRLYKAFHLQSWEVFNSRKICEVTYARLQGVEALKEHFKNSKFPCNTEDYMPVVFSPPRDGRLLMEPVPIFGRPIINPLPLHHSPPDLLGSYGVHGPIDENGHIIITNINDDCDGEEEKDNEDVSGGRNSSEI